MEMNFCRRCGEALTLINKHVYTCKSDHIIFANANPSTSIWLVNDKNEVLVTTRGIEPGKGAYDSPGGFVDGSFETVDEAVTRELKEELGLDTSDYSKLNYVVSTTGKYEYKNEMLPTLDLVYWAHINKDAVITPKDDVMAYTFLPITQLNPDLIYIDAIRLGYLEFRKQIG